MSKNVDLFAAAISVRQNAHAPYSGFKVGAALVTENGKVYLGCNVENAAYPQGLCAEAGAIAAMVAAGQSVISKICIVGDSKEPVTPCGGCRQKIREFANPDTAVLVGDLDGIKHEFTMEELLPVSFGPDNLKGRK